MIHEIEDNFSDIREGMCNYILTTRRCKPKGKIKVILVGESLGY